MRQAYIYSVSLCTSLFFFKLVIVSLNFVGVISWEGLLILDFNCFMPYVHFFPSLYDLSGYFFFKCCQAWNFGKLESNN